MFWFLLYSTVQWRHKSSFTTFWLCVIHTFRPSLLLAALLCYKCFYSVSCYATYVFVLLSAGIELIFISAVGTVPCFGFKVSIMLTIDWCFGCGWPGLTLGQRHFSPSCHPASEEAEGAQETWRRQSCDSWLKECSISSGVILSNKTGASWLWGGGPLLRGQLGIGQWVLTNCVVHYLFCLLIFFPLPFLSY